MNDSKPRGKMIGNREFIQNVASLTINSSSRSKQTLPEQGQNEWPSPFAPSHFETEQVTKLLPDFNSQEPTLSELSELRYGDNDLDDDEFEFEKLSCIFFFAFSVLGMCLKWPMELITITLSMTFACILVMGRRMNFLPTLVWKNRKGRRNTLREYRPTIRNFILRKVFGITDEGEKIKCFKNLPLPDRGLTLHHPAGVVKSNPKVRHINACYNLPHRRSDEIEVSGPRPFVEVELPGNIVKQSLLDIGSQCTSISPQLLEIIEERTGPLPRTAETFNVQPVGKDNVLRDLPGVYMDLKIGALELPRVPVIIFDNEGSDFSLGTNLIVAKRFEFSYFEDKLFISFSSSNIPRVPAVLKPTAAHSIKIVNEAVLLPGESKIMQAEIPDVEKLKNNFQGQTVEISSEKDRGFPNVTCSGITKVKKTNKVLIKVTNTDPKNETCLPKHAEVAEARLVPQANVIDLDPLFCLKEEMKSIPVDRLTDCYCKLNMAESAMFTEFCTMTGVNHTQEPRLYKFEGVEEEVKKDGVTLMGATCWPRARMYLKPFGSNGYMGYTAEYLREKLSRLGVLANKKEIFLLLPPRQHLTLEMRRVIILLNEILKVRLLYLDLKKVCHDCDSISFGLKPDMITAPEVHVHIQRTAPPPSKENSRLEEVPQMTFKYFGAPVIVYRTAKALKVQVHVPNTHLDEPYRPNLLLILLMHLRTAGVTDAFQISVDGHDNNMIAQWTSDIAKAICFLPKFHKGPQKLKELDGREVPIEINHTKCPCLSCARIHDKEQVDASEPCVILKGNLNELALETRQFLYRPKIEKEPLQVMGSTLKCPTDFDLDGFGDVDPKVLDAWTNEFPSYLPEGEEYHEEGNYVPPKWRDHFDINKWVPEHCRERFEKIMDKRHDVFTHSKHLWKPIQGYQYDFETDLKEGEVIYNRPFRTSTQKLRIIDIFIANLLKSGHIEPIDSPHANNLFLVRRNSNVKLKASKSKSDPGPEQDPDNQADPTADFRCVEDLRLLNTHIIVPEKSSDLVRKIDTLYEKLNGQKFMVSLDLNSAYKSLMASERVKRLTCFWSPFSEKYGTQKFTFKSAIEGSLLVPNFFSKIMIEILSPAVRKNSLVFLDDIVLFSDNEEHLMDLLDDCLGSLQKTGLLVNFAKFKPFLRKTRILGVNVDLEKADGVMEIIDERKEEFMSFEPPCDLKSVQRVLGTATYMAQFLDSFALVAAPLMQLLKKKHRKGKFELNELELKSFMELKKAILNAPKLHLINFDLPLEIECDSSIAGIGCSLSNVLPDGTRRLLRFGSRKFTLMESLSTSSLYKEALAIVYSVAIFRYYVENSNSTIICTDMISLLYLLAEGSNPDDLKMARISHRLHNLNVKWCLRHVPGSSLRYADTLSREHERAYYTCAFSTRANRLKLMREGDLKVPESWIDVPNRILSTEDILEGLRTEVILSIELSEKVFEKRLKNLDDIWQENLGTPSPPLSEAKRERIKKFGPFKSKTKKNEMLQADGVKLTPLTNTDTIINANLIAKYQSENSFIANLKTIFLTQSREKIPKAILKKYRLLNNSIVITRKTRSKPFSEPSNIRILTDIRLGLVILTAQHLLTHAGINVLLSTFNQTFYMKNARHFATLVCHTCKACRLNRQANRKYVHEGRFPLPSGPNQLWCVDFAVFKPLHFGNKQITSALVIIDAYSKMVIAHMTKDMTANTFLNCLRQTLSVLGDVHTILSDNAKSFCNPIINAKLKDFGVKRFIKSSAYRSTSNSLAERSIQTLKNLLKLNSKTYGRDIFSIFYSTLMQINNRPIPYTKSLTEGEGFQTPFSIHHNRPAQNKALDVMYQSLAPQDQKQYQKQWAKLMKEYDQHIDDIFKKNNAKERISDELVEGAIVLLKNETAHKEEDRFLHNLFVVKKIGRKKVQLEALFGTEKDRFVHQNTIKMYYGSHILDLLPNDLKQLLGEGLTEDEILRRSAENPSYDNRPDDIVTVNRFDIPRKLRHQIIPKSINSIPAIRSQILSDTSFSFTTELDSNLSVVSDGTVEQTNVSTDQPDQITNKTSAQPVITNKEPQLQTSPQPSLDSPKSRQAPSPHDTGPKVKTPANETDLNARQEFTILKRPGQSKTVSFKPMVKVRKYNRTDDPSWDVSRYRKALRNVKELAKQKITNPIKNRLRRNIKPPKRFADEFGYHITSKKKKP